MSKFNVTDKRASRSATATGPLAAKTGKPRLTHEGGTGYARAVKSELFLLAATSLDITADTFYAGGDDRVKRFTSLAGEVAVADPQWIADFLRWLRTDGNIRTAAIVGAVEAARAMVQAKIPGGRALVASVLQRADEPGELLAYHLTRYGRKLPMPIKRGAADAALCLYSEHSMLKYDTASHALRFGDVIELTHPKADNPWSDALFRTAIDRRHGRDNTIPFGLVVLRANAQLRESAKVGAMVLTSPQMLREAGMTWEDALSLAGDRVDKRQLWEALTPSMGYMALLRNLRNFDESGVSDAVAASVAERLADPEQVRRSRQLPMRFLSAYRHAPSLRWAYPLERALDEAVSSIPALPGRTLVLVDTSGSMNDTFSKDGSLRRWDAAVVFGLALARRAESADVVSYSAGWGHASKVFDLRSGESLLKAIERWKSGGFFIGGGTDTAGAAQRHFAGHDRVVILTDEQHGMFSYGGDVGAVLPATTPLYVFNLAGYQKGSIVDNPNRVTLGGLTDAMFRLIPTIEAGVNGAWPWVTAD